MSRNVTKRYDYADYLNIGTSGTPDFVLMGTGFTKLDEEFGPKTESVQYINERSASSEVVSYETSFPFEADQIMDEKAINALYTVGRNHLVGSDAEFEYVRVELWNPSDDENTYEARLFVVSAEVSDSSGESKMQLTGNLNAVGDPVIGTFNTVTRTFTAATAA